MLLPLLTGCATDMEKSEIPDMEPSEIPDMKLSEFPDTELSEISKTPYVFDESVIKIGELGDTDVFLTEKTGVLFPGPRRFQSSEQEVINEKIGQYRTMIENHPELKYYVFYLELIQSSEHNPLNDDYPNADAGQSLE